MTTTTDTFTATIHIAGSMPAIEDTCRRFCLRGLCVSVTPTRFIFTGGAEDGAAIGLINYPRFPSTPKAIRSLSRELADALLGGCCQRSCTIVFPDFSEFVANQEITAPR